MNSELNPVITVQAKRDQVRAWLGSGSINFFGVQLSGKDTQCRRLSQWLDAPILGGGDILRNAKHVPERVRAIIHRGDLAPVEDYLAIMTPYFAKSEFAGRPLLLSAVGRHHGEEPGVIQSARDAGHEIRAAVLLELSEEQVWKRWHLLHELMDREERLDDTEEGLKQRLHRFRKDTKPVLEFYRDLGLLVPIDANLSPDVVEAEILDGLYARAIESR